MKCIIDIVFFQFLIQIFFSESVTKCHQCMVEAVPGILSCFRQRILGIASLMSKNHRYNGYFFCQNYCTEHKKQIIAGPLLLKCQMVFIHKFFEEEFVPCPSDKHFEHIACHLPVIKWMIRWNLILMDHPVC